MEQQETPILEAALCAQYCNLGMTNALAFLQMVFSSIVPVDRIIYSTTHLITQAHNELANIDREKNYQPYVETALVRPNKVDSFCFVHPDKTDAFLLDNSSEGDGTAFVMQAYHARYHSMLSVTLFEKNAYIYSVALMTYEDNAYSRATAEVLFRLTRAFAKEVEKNTEEGDGTYPVEFPPYISSATELLKISRDLSHVVEMAEKIAQTDISVLITGETGVGKDVLAELIRELSKRAQGPFVKVNCGAVPETLIEGSFFGYEKGAFTGAMQSHAGFFEQASNGTLFLDEIGDLSLQAQIRLLRVLETHEIQRIGSEKTKKVDFRLLAATNKDLKRAIQEGTFREDLYYRISHFPIHIPPLRQRQHDIPLLVNYFLQTKTKAFGLVDVPQVTQAEMQKLLAYPFPGNVRELLHILERSLLLSADTYNHIKHLVFALETAPTPQPHDLETLFAELPPLEELADRYMAYVLQYAEGKLTGPGSASAILGIHPNTLRARLKKMGEEKARKRGRPGKAYKEERVMGKA